MKKCSATRRSPARTTSKKQATHKALLDVIYAHIKAGGQITLQGGRLACAKKPKASARRVRTDVDGKIKTIRRLYKQGLNVNEISRQIGASYMGIRNALKRRGLIATLKPKPATRHRKPSVFTDEHLAALRSGKKTLVRRPIIQNANQSTH